MMCFGDQKWQNTDNMINLKHAQNVNLEITVEDVLQLLTVQQETSMQRIHNVGKIFSYKMRKASLAVKLERLVFFNHRDSTFPTIPS